MPTKRRNFTFALTQDNERIIDLVKQLPGYAFIYHDKDKDAEPHYHYYIEFPNPRSFESVSEDLDIPKNMLQKVFSKQGILSYLTHENEPSKYHYNKSDIITNFPETAFESKKCSDTDYKRIVYVTDQYRQGLISYSDMLLDLQDTLCDITPQALFRVCISAIQAENRNGSLSRSEFLVPTHAPNRGAINNKTNKGV